MKNILRLVGIAGSLFGGVMAVDARGFSAVNPNQPANEINKQRINPCRVEMKSAAFPQYDMYRASSNQRRVDQERLAYDRHEMRTVDLMGHPIELIPKKNFSAKRAAVEESITPPKTIPSKKAAVKDRTIHPYTPAGEEELKEQLKKTP